ncbi:unnamed protein product [Ciceribacter sp. T2.26MG-112.2]|nr:unnamed protein product [Ciceribacter naphthalenivorans]
MEAAPLSSGVDAMGTDYRLGKDQGEALPRCIVHHSSIE